jgi:nuclear pore complex protein Nup98-Nup96
LLRKREVEVNQKELESCSAGRGVNIPAEVTLLGCWPKFQSIDTLDMDSTNSTLSKHKQKLQSIPGTTFVDFTLQTGAWTLTVQHFSRYGLDDDDDDDDDDIEVDDARVPEPKVKTPTRLSHAVEEEDF